MSGRSVAQYLADVDQGEEVARLTRELVAMPPMAVLAAHAELVQQKAVVEAEIMMVKGALMMARVDEPSPAGREQRP